MFLKKIQLAFILGFLVLGLAACGGDDSDAGLMSSDGTLADYNPDHPSMIVEDNGVVHQEAIYKAWPQ